ncbi:cupin domain-containing protein [Streptomyces rochei]|uniref:cupin domain-containing protein n=1 Tax=Streptomyces rochei TaxID=1928 RepID=UPI0038257875
MSNRGGGARTIPLAGKAVGAEVFLTGQTLCEGGAAIALHTHHCPESVTVLEGDAIAEIDGTEHHPLRHHLRSRRHAPPLPQRLRHRSHAHRVDLRFLDAPRTLVETGVTVRGDGEQDRAAATGGD